MKKRLLALLLPVLLLSGCGRGEVEEARALQSRFAAAQRIALEAEITWHGQDAGRTFSVRAAWDEAGTTTTVTAPESLAGISATVTGEEMLLRYEGTALSAGKGSLSPATGVAWLVRALAEGYLLDCGRETLDGMACLRLALDTTDHTGGKVLCTVWLERDTAVPCYAEFSQNGAVVLTLRTLAFDMTEKEEA